MASALIVGFVWKVNAISRQNRLNHDLIQVVAHNEQATVQQLLAAGADPNARNVPGADRETDFLSTLRSLFRKEPRKTLEYGRQTVLSIALSNDDIRLVRLLLDAGADVNLRWGSGYTPLIDAALSSEEEAIVKLLLERGADVNARDPEGRTALQLARKAWYRPISVNRSVARLIEQAGAKEQEKREERPR
jgi:uncharacterized protein